MFPPYGFFSFYSVIVFRLTWSFVFVDSIDVINNQYNTDINKQYLLNIRFSDHSRIDTVTTTITEYLTFSFNRNY